ncbi:glycosyltransferase family 2 protein [Rhizobium sp. S163]|uniref:glycosyltransferase family 2 protein n=1 Tax=Rhizobium sp. S163 TaxID=3055039 RepID=UPI0025A982F2|nr:glycosyltransferase family 2 protein [Rhizobium sp. S163]MDM9646672.1 glycosyltransferase family 2 protein [Rhizobium sp. S163]
MVEPLITIAVPSFNQGRFLDEALSSIFNQNLPVEVFVLDGGSTDETLSVIHKWQHKLAGWRSRPDDGQAAAINEGVALGTAPYVCWLNSDDYFIEGGLRTLVDAFAECKAPAVYGGCLNYVQGSGKSHPVWVEDFDIDRLAIRCIISQPATLIRRSAWDAVSGVDPNLHMVMDYDLWWRLYKFGGALTYIDSTVAVNREHGDTKTKTLRRRHYREAIATVRKHYGRVPYKWWLAQPYAVWFKTLVP